MTVVREICLSFDEDLSALRDGELTSERAAEVEAHLAACERCRARIASFAAVDTSLRGVAAPSVAADLESRLLARLADERRAATPRATTQAAKRRPAASGVAPEARRRPPRRPGWRLALASSLAAAAAAVVVYLGLVRSPGPLGPQDPSVRQGEAAGAVAVVDEKPVPNDRADLDQESDEDLSLAIELDTLEDLEVIANLEILEQLGATGGKDRG